MDPRAFDTILRLTNDTDERVRYDATLALGKLGDDRAIEPLVSMVFEDDETLPAVGVLSDFGLKAIEPFRRLLREGNGSVRLEAVNGLGSIASKFESSECIDMLRACLSDPDESVREDARYWLEQELPAGATIHP